MSSKKVGERSVTTRASTTRTALDKTKKLSKKQVAENPDKLRRRAFKQAE